ncbi:periplasmic binding protein-like II, partial [Delitschia confertaspora ATCC 74209]
SLRIATSLLWLEHTPQPYAISHFYNSSSTSSSPASLVSGGVASIATDKSIDLAANAETQGLKQYANHKNIRLIYIICEVAYRIVANKAAGIKDVRDLKGKKVGTIPGTSAAVFVEKFLREEGGLKSGDYQVVSGDVCMKLPCASRTLPAMLKSGAVDAFGVWEPTVELGAKLLENKAVIFQNASIYREVYALYSTTEKLNDKKTRADIVTFVMALNHTLDVFSKGGDSVYGFVADRVGVDKGVVKDVWKDHKWSGIWGPDLIDFLVDEDRMQAAVDKRQVTPRADLEKFLDRSI